MQDQPIPPRSGTEYGEVLDVLLEASMTSFAKTLPLTDHEREVAWALLRHEFTLAEVAWLLQNNRRKMKGGIAR